MISRLRQRVFYGWWMVASGFGIQLLAAGLLGQAYGAYVVVLQKDFGWSKTALSGAYSLQQIESGLLGPVQGWIIDKFGPRTVMRFGLVIFGTGFMILSQVDSLPAFYAVFLMMAVGNTLSGFFPLTVAIVNWFERQRARALSTMSLGLAVGGLIVPLVAYSLETLGWRETAFISGVLIIALGLPLAQVIRRRPEDYGEVMDGLRAARAVATEQPQASSSPPRDFTLREALRTPAFWFISLGHGSALLVVTAVNVHVVSHLAEGLGYSLAAAALVVTLMTGFQVVGMLVGGLIGDRFDKRLIAVSCMAMHTAGLLLVAYAVTFAMVLAFAVLHGIAWGLRGPLMQAIRADYFGRSSFGVIMGFSSMIVMLGTIAGPLVAGFLADRTGGYETGFTLLAVLAGCGSIFFLISRRPSLADDRAPEEDDTAAKAAVP